ncbi:MAG TPA: hypothetical protein VGQ35_12795 [Dongiaceae bacterium]|nr:hypothetical protein [Dongiaceae bacterium]
MASTDLSYEDWIDYVFDHAVPFYEQAWYWEPDADWWSPRPDQAIEYLTRLFENPEPLTEQFADSQIGQGLYYLVSASAGSYCRFLTDAAVPIEAGVSCIAAMQVVFARLFQPRCEPILSHLDEPGGNELNKICYMWWDIVALGAISKPGTPDPIHDACLSVMCETLKFPNPACQESALHGLGHWAHAYPEFTGAAIDAYLAANPKLRPELVRYAQAARSGCIQ